MMIHATNVVLWTIIIAMGVGLLIYIDSVDAQLVPGANPGKYSHLDDDLLNIQPVRLSFCQFFNDGYVDGWCSVEETMVCVGPPLVPMCFHADYRSEMGAFQSGFNRGARDNRRQ